MSNSALAARSPQHAAVAEAGQRLRLVAIRQRIDEAQVLDLVIAMAQTGRDLTINPDTLELEGEEMLSPDIRQKYLAQLVNKIINNAVAPKEISGEIQSSAASWAAELESPGPPEVQPTPTLPKRAKMQPEPTSGVDQPPHNHG